MKLAKVKERILVEIVGVYAQVELWKWKFTYHFVENSDHFVMKIFDQIV